MTEDDALALFEELPECSIRYVIGGDSFNNTYVRPQGQGMRSFPGEDRSATL